MPRNRKSGPQRKSYMMDPQTLKDLGMIQSALRAASSAEALRHAVRNYALLVDYASKGKQIQIVSGTDAPLLLNVPKLGGGA